MKCIIKPSYPHMLVLDFNEVVQPNRPSVVTYTAYIQSRVASGQILLVLANVPDEKTDDQFLAFWKSSDKDEALAVQSFQSTFPAVEPVPTPAPTPKPASTFVSKRK